MKGIKLANGKGMRSISLKKNNMMLKKIFISERRIILFAFIHHHFPSTELPTVYSAYLPNNKPDSGEFF